MKKTLKVTFGTMLAMSMEIAPVHAFWHDPTNIAVWVEGTYTRPSQNGLSIGDLLFASSGSDFDGGRRHIFLDVDNEFDYSLGISYRIPCTHTRLFFHYDHFDADDDKGEVDIRNIGLEPAIILGPTLGFASVEENAHEYRLGITHDLHFGDHFCLDLLAFFEYDKVRITMAEIISQQQTGDIVFINTRSTENEIKGWGPGVGFMTRWYACNPHWHFFAGAAWTLLASDHEYHQEFHTSNDSIFYIYDPENTDSIIGKLDIKFGINWRCRFGYYLGGAVYDISLGMRYMNLFNALKNGNTAWNPNALNAPFASGQTVPPHFAANLGPAQDWGRWGPFLKFRIGGVHS